MKVVQIMGYLFSEIFQSLRFQNKLEPLMQVQKTQIMLRNRNNPLSTTTKRVN